MDGPHYSIWFFAAMVELCREFPGSNFPHPFWGTAPFTLPILQPLWNQHELTNWINLPIFDHIFMIFKTKSFNLNTSNRSRWRLSSLLIDQIDPHFELNPPYPRHLLTQKQIKQTKPNTKKSRECNKRNWNRKEIRMNKSPFRNSSQKTRKKMVRDRNIGAGGLISFLTGRCGSPSGHPQVTHRFLPSRFMPCNVEQCIKWNGFIKINQKPIKDSKLVVNIHPRSASNS